MYTDLFGKRRVKLALHLHTKLSDGRCTPLEVATRYRNEGYDAIAMTDHWYFGESRTLAGFPILPGVEYDVGGRNSAMGVYHIVGLCMEREPKASQSMSVQQLIDAIHEAGGLAVLAHPAWSLNTPEQILALRDVDATEIYNAVSERGMSRRADSSLIVDMIAARGCYLPLLATDDAHYYGEGNEEDATQGWIMAACDDVSPDSVKRAIREGRFYATQGPEIHLSRCGNVFRVDCSPSSEIVFFSNLVYSKRVTVGDGLTHAEYEAKAEETYVRAFVKDANGKQAWSNVLTV